VAALGRRWQYSGHVGGISAARRQYGNMMVLTWEHGVIRYVITRLTLKQSGWRRILAMKEKMTVHLGDD
jgi:hypothetical protein